jgi:hypothetical protein
VHQFAHVSFPSIRRSCAPCTQLHGFDETFTLATNILFFSLGDIQARLQSTSVCNHGSPLIVSGKCNKRLLGRFAASHPLLFMWTASVLRIE